MSIQNPPPRDVFETHFRQLVEFHAEDRARLYDMRGKITNQFAQLRTTLVGKNDMRKVQFLAAGNKDKAYLLDISGWDFNNEKFRSAASEIHACHSIIFDVMMLSLNELGRAQELNNIKINQSLANPQVTGMTMQDPGLVERLRGSIGSVFKPRWQKEKEMALSFVSDIFNYMKDSRTKWELYISHHWDNTSKAVLWQQDANPYEFLEELEALDDVEMRTMMLIDIGYRRLAREMGKDRDALMQGILAAKTQSMQPQLMMPGSFGQQGGQQIPHEQPARALPISEQDFP